MNIPEILIVQCKTKSQVKVMGWNPGVYIFLFNNMLGEKMFKGDKKGGKCIFFPKLVKRMHIFSPIDSIKKAENFCLRRAPPHYNKFQFEKIYQSRRGGGGKNLIYTPLKGPF